MSRWLARAVTTACATAHIAAAVVMPAAALGATAPIARSDGMSDPVELARRWHPTSQVSASFGYSVAVSGTFAVVGSQSRTVSGQAGAGSASVYAFKPESGWTWATELDLGTPGAGEQAGRAVAAAGDTAFVGVPYRAPTLPGLAGGRIYVYRDAGGSAALVTVLTAPDTLTNTIGEVMAADGDTLVVGCPNATVDGVMSGVVLVYTRGPSGWTGPVRVVPTAPQAGQGFGTSVSVQGDDLAIGSMGWGGGKGRIYMFRRQPSGAWAAAGDVVLTAPTTSDVFGKSVAVSNGMLVAGAPGRTVGAVALAGAAYVFKWNGASWIPVADLQSPAYPHGDEQYGDRVVMSRDLVLVASMGGPAPGWANAGAVYAYRPIVSGAAYLKSLDPAGLAQNSIFGAALATDGQTIVVGGPEASGIFGVFEGSVWFYGGAQTYTAMANTPYAVGAPGLLGNDFAGGRATTAELASGPSHGSVVVNADGSFAYTPAVGYVGADSFQYIARNNLGTSQGTVSLQVAAPSPKTPTSITIRSNLGSIRLGKTFNLTGILKPGKYLDPCVVWVKKPGAKRWTYSSARLAFSANTDGSCNWWYRYLPKKIKGTYAFKVSFPGDTTRAGCVSSNIVSVKVK
jgi:hypothetical protein